MNNLLGRQIGLLFLMFILNSYIILGQKLVLNLGVNGTGIYQLGLNTSQRDDFKSKIGLSAGTGINFSYKLWKFNSLIYLYHASFKIQEYRGVSSTGHTLESPFFNKTYEYFGFGSSIQSLYRIYPKHYLGATLAYEKRFLPFISTHQVSQTTFGIPIGLVYGFYFGRSGLLAGIQVDLNPTYQEAQRKTFPSYKEHLWLLYFQYSFDLFKF